MDAETERDRFVSLLDEAARRRKPIRFWWRDDDAVSVTPALQAMTAVQTRHRVPLALAVIPKPAEPALADYLKDCPEIAVFQHGWQHKSQRDKARGERASEFPHSRPIDESLDDLTRGFTRLTNLFGDRFLPVLTPPWNRVSKAVRTRRHETGLIGLSVFSRAKFEDPHLVNCHVDIIKWRGVNAFAGRLTGFRRLVAQTRRRLAGLDQPIGLLTHHLVHDDAANAFVDEVLAITANHPGATWPTLPDLFKLPK